jgi:hypothetical protein
MVRRRHPSDHPPTVYVREDSLLQGVVDFFANRIFCPDRLKLIEAELRPVDDEPLQQRRRTMAALRRAIGRVVLIKVGRSSSS